MHKSTLVEIAALPQQYNLVDGHAYRNWNPAELEIVNSCAKIFLSVDRRHQSSIEVSYLEQFFKLGKQSFVPEALKCFMCMTASTAIEVIANYLRLKKMSVSLIEPCFDNLADILKRHNVPLEVFLDHLMEENDEEFERHLRTIRSDAIFIVSPNNPTGKFLRREQFKALTNFCKSTKKLLLLDACFRFYLPLEEVYDQYQILLESGVDFIIVEDTGKTWPTLEIKAPFFCASKNLVEDLSDIYADFILHVSPFSVCLMTEFLKLSERDTLGQIRDLVSQNRRVLYQELESTFLVPEEAPFASMTWLRITNKLLASNLIEKLSVGGIHILPGNQFFWSDPSLGNKFVRVALARDPDMFKIASKTLGELCRKIGVQEW